MTSTGGKVTYYVCSTRDVEEQNDSLFGPTNRGTVPSGRRTARRALAAEPVRQNANGTYDILSKQTRKATVAYVEYKHSRTVGLQYRSCYVALILGLSIAYIMTMRVFIRNIAGGDSSR